MIPKQFRDIVDLSFVLYDEPTNGKFDNIVYTHFIDSHLYRGYIDICQRTRCAPGLFELTTVAGQMEYDYPAGCLIIKSVRWRENMGTRLERLSQDQINQLVSGAPAAYYQTPQKIGIYKTPNVSYVLDIEGYRGPDAPFETRDEEPELIPLQFRNVLAYYLCAEYARVDKNAIKAQPGLFERWLGTYMDAIHEMTEALHEGRNDDMYVGVM